MKRRQQGMATVEFAIVGTLVLLFPWLAVVAVTSAPFVTASWGIREGAATADGIEMGEMGGVTVVGFTRGGRLNCYCHPERIT